MMLIDETAIADEVLPIEALKAHLRLGSGFATGELQEQGAAGAGVYPDGECMAGR